MNKPFSRWFSYFHLPSGPLLFISCIDTMRRETISIRQWVEGCKDVGGHAKQGKTCGVKGEGPKRYRLKYTGSSLVSVTACQGEAAVCQGLTVLSPDIFVCVLRSLSPVPDNIQRRSTGSFVGGYNEPVSFIAVLPDESSLRS